MKYFAFNFFLRLIEGDVGLGDVGSIDISGHVILHAAQEVEVAICQLLVVLVPLLGDGEDLTEVAAAASALIFIP